MVAVVAVVVATSVAVAVETAGNCINYRIEKGLRSLFLLPYVNPLYLCQKKNHEYRNRFQ
jgi:hypothetical protein